MITTTTTPSEMHRPIDREERAASSGDGLVLAVEAMATRFELVLPAGRADGLDCVRSRAAGEAALEAILECDRRWSRFRRDSALAHLERNAHLFDVRLDADDHELFATALDVHARSGGAFDVSGGASDALVLDRDRSTLRATRAVSLDLGAIAKGHALDLAARELREAGIDSAFLHGGTSSVLAIGAPPGGKAWRVVLAGSGRVVDLRDRSLSVSAQRGRGHVIDPRTGAAVASRALAWAVAREARVAEAWSTALLVLGRADVDDERLLERGLEGER